MALLSESCPVSTMIWMRGAALLDLREHFQAAGVGQADVEQDQVGAVGFAGGEFQARAAVRAASTR